MKILIKITGSIACYKMCEVVSSLKKMNHEVKVVASKSSLNFIGAATWEALSGEPVFTDDFTPERRLDHIYLNDWCDLVVLAPATAKSLNQLSIGVGDGVVNTLFLSRKLDAPYLIFPAMNPRMWNSPTVENSLDKFSKMKNIKIIKPSSGAMACGHVGEGRLVEPEVILDEILKYDVKPKKLLITFGGTSESVDGVRSITNFSSGKTGRELAASFRQCYSVTALGSDLSIQNIKGIEGAKRTPFTSSEELETELYKEISKVDYDMVIHLAAVSDFVPSEKLGKKISSDQEEVSINLVKRSKILNQIREVSKNKEATLVSFKLTHNQNDEEVKQKIKSQFEGSDSDYIVHNKLEESRGEAHKYQIWNNKLEVVKSGETKTQMAQDLIELGG